jgi:hypothetical protein
MFCAAFLVSSSMRIWINDISDDWLVLTSVNYS